MDKHFIHAAIGGLIVGVLVAVAGTYMYHRGVMLATGQPEAADGPAATSMPLQNPLGGGGEIDFSVYIINASGDESAGDNAEEDLEDAGFRVVDVEESSERHNTSSLRYTASKEHEALLLEDWVADDWGTLVLSDDLKATDSYDAILTIGFYEE